MISNVDITSIHSDNDEDIKKYARKKIGKLDPYMPRHARKSTQAEVILKETKTKARVQYTVEVILKMPIENITAKETTVNMYAAIDIVEEKLKTQLRKYKSNFSAKKGKREVAVRKWLGKIVPKKK